MAKISPEDMAGLTIDELAIVSDILKLRKNLARLPVLEGDTSPWHNNDIRYLTDSLLNIVLSRTGYRALIVADKIFNDT